MLKEKYEIQLKLAKIKPIERNMENTIAEVNELTSNPEHRVTEMRFGDAAYVMIDWAEKRFFIHNTELAETRKVLVDSFEQLCFVSQGLLRGEPLMKTIEVGLEVYA